MCNNIFAKFFSNFGMFSQANLLENAKITFAKLRTWNLSLQHYSHHLLLAFKFPWDFWWNKNVLHTRTQNTSHVFVNTRIQYFVPSIVQILPVFRAESGKKTPLQRNSQAGKYTMCTTAPKNVSVCFPIIAYIIIEYFLVNPLLATHGKTFFLAGKSSGCWSSGTPQAPLSPPTALQSCSFPCIGSQSYCTVVSSPCSIIEQNNLCVKPQLSSQLKPRFLRYLFKTWTDSMVAVPESVFIKPLCTKILILKLILFWGYSQTSI